MPKLTRSLKNKLKAKGIKLPTDARTKQYKQQIAKYGGVAQYSNLLTALTQNTVELRSEQFIDTVESQMRQLGIGEFVAFNVAITDFATGFTRDMTFPKFPAFSKFLSSAMDGNDAKYSESDEFYRAFHMSGEFAFEYASVVVSATTGGYQNLVIKERMQVITPRARLICYNPYSKRNNCGIACVNHLLGKDLKMQKKKYNLKEGEAISPAVLKEIYDTNNDVGAPPLRVIAEDETENIDLTTANYIYLLKDHYVVIKEAEPIVMDSDEFDTKVKRGFLTFDFETRRDLDNAVSVPKICRDEYGDIIYENDEKTYDVIVEAPIIDVLCCVRYRHYKSKEEKEITFSSYYTDGGEFVSSAKQFIRWLRNKAEHHKFFQCIAHNGSRFDFYLLLNAMKDIGHENTSKVNDVINPVFRGFSVIGMEMYSHLFRDSCCFLTASLSGLCKSFKVGDCKIKTFDLHGETITNEQLCFYKPELNVKKFLRLEVEDPMFWREYVRYCKADCTSLMRIWDIYTANVDKLVEKMHPSLLRRCSVNSCLTIASHAKKLFTNIVGGNWSDNNCPAWNYNSSYKKYVNFLRDPEHERKRLCDERINFVKLFKRGGISHCNKAGKHTRGVASVDITSQYPASMVLMKVPAGFSRWTKEYDPAVYGLYHIENAVYERSAFKPACGQFDGACLNWKKASHATDYIDSEMLAYLRKNHGLKSFTVVRALVSDECVDGNKIFGRYVNTLFAAKAEQDVYKANDAEEYNPALREVIKLYLNALSGKLVEDPSKYSKSKVINQDCVDKARDANKKVQRFNGMYLEDADNSNVNVLVLLGVMVYSYSKRLLFEYIDMLPERSDSVIATETDSIYFAKADLAHLQRACENYEGEYPCMFGSALGNIKIEKNTDEVAYFLGKKMYYIAGNKIIRGIPASTIDNAGNRIELVDRKLFEDVYAWKPGDAPITKTFKTIRKNLYGEASTLTDTSITRTVMPTMQYNCY